MKYDMRTAIIHLCLFIIALILLQPAIGWGGVLGLWIILSVNNFEQRVQTEKLIKRNNLGIRLGNLFSIASAIPNVEGGGPWSSKDKTSAEEEADKTQPEEEVTNDTEN